MSDTTITPTDPPKPEQPTRSVPDTMISQRFIYALCCLPIVAGIIIGAFKYLDAAVVSTLCATALAGLLGNPSTFFYGAAKQDTPQTPQTKP